MFNLFTSSLNIFIFYFCVFEKLVSRCRGTAVTWCGAQWSMEVMTVKDNFIQDGNITIQLVDDDDGRLVKVRKDCGRLIFLFYMVISIIVRLIFFLPLYVIFTVDSNTKCTLSCVIIYETTTKTRQKRWYAAKLIRKVTAMNFQRFVWEKK